jgi:hypothetical protein
MNSGFEWPANDLTSEVMQFHCDFVTGLVIDEVNVKGALMSIGRQDFAR